MDKIYEKITIEQILHFCDQTKCAVVLGDGKIRKIDFEKSNKNIISYKFLYLNRELIKN